MTVVNNQYGFVWGDDCLVERTVSSDKKPKFKVVRVYCMNGEVIEIVMRPRSTKVVKFKKERQ